MVCPNKCAGGTAAKQSSVKPPDVGMTEADIADAHLQDRGRLFWCRHCGRIWEKYRDELGKWVSSKVGTYGGPGPQQGFIPYNGVL